MLCFVDRIVAGVWCVIACCVRSFTSKEGAGYHTQ